MSQLTLVALILLVVILWKFGPWFRSQRILSYEFPEGWWRHVSLIVPEYVNWSRLRKNRLEDYIRLFIDKIEFVTAPSIQDEFEITHRVAIATQAFLLFENIRPNPLTNIEKIYIEQSHLENNDSYGLIKLCWLEKELNFKILVDATPLGSRLRDEEKECLASFMTDGRVADSDINSRLIEIFGQAHTN